MSILKKGLPISICPEENNPAGNKYQCRLIDIDKQFIIVSSRDTACLKAGEKIIAEFFIESNSFTFDATIHGSENDDKVIIEKPEVIHKKRIRNVDRMSLREKVNYTLWTEKGRFDAETRDISERGIRVVGSKALKKGSLLSINLYLKEPRIRLICQAQVAWCRTAEENEHLHETGIHFTTLSNETRKKLSKFVKKVMEVQGVEQTHWDESAYSRFDT